jgi:hypothetical protein
MPFVPVQITGLGSGPHYSRQIELTDRQLAAFEHEAGNMSAPLGDVAGDLRTQIEAAFGSQGATGVSGPWQQLSTNYATWKSERGPGLPILVGLEPTSRVGHRTDPPGQRRNAHQTYKISGKMMKALLVPLRDGLTWQISPTRMRYLPDSDIAGYHETGTDKMPPRPPVDVSVAFLHSVDRTFVRWLAAVMKKAGL